MSRAFVKGDDSDLSGEELPERPISPFPNYVTSEGMAQLRQRY
jgi:transcription elongation factor GreB